MIETAHLLQPSTFPPITRDRLETLQVNLGFRCNLSCVHCHVNAGPKRKEEMDRETAEDVLTFLQRHRLKRLDLTGGAPELNANFRYLVTQARALGVRVIDRSNLVILLEEEQRDLADFLAAQEVEIVASLPCYLEENVDQQRGKGSYAQSIDALIKLNRLGYGMPGSGLNLNLVYNPLGPSLPPPQGPLEAEYRKQLRERYGIHFNQLLTITNMPIQRFGSYLHSKGEFNNYLQLLREAYQPCNLENVMCRTLLSVDWRGYLYDCDFNQMLKIHLKTENLVRPRLRDLIDMELSGLHIQVAEHCYGCTAGQGSSCGGALNE
ncbi:MAG: radical SAM protein [gamma proteobacterium symbiont of Ctena orbiculata]|uniref:Arsenosugar biosynthesis radical SAM protein ArsS n=1 Tax=Candidatus Thiodiazotropha taylori TaxID=2792791 RepID=A0A944QTF3_9GAMM|nr:arsenosugar biosynthesis radical SAM protein ArsS [Candidatus Thiodiazotropha taylori]PUB86623.1 MAG: radical SAM protein [gamma proteobacterium symbiont of Ctena orbiculata]MBT3026178.1 arsenosugar biosynthesis radical SAM protein ArsS [Candidatus Thiodiazotropha taylori]MBT3035891.1 arsenosugar biosynthesis radical SAM protein ArsS [Candidatus Thiodiazotropha taylori]MBV2135990.1 arsenosugar biosynthesis radical SAM protein ArsS [Candidatus Thiodiazotropha taylori]